MVALSTTSLLSPSFCRLKWSVFEPISKIVVAPESDVQGAPWLLFSSHPIATEPATEIPTRWLPLTIMCLDDHEGLDEDDEYYESPEPVLIVGKNGGVVTVGDVVEQLAPFLLEHKEMILEVKAPMLNQSPGDLSQDHRVFLEGFFGMFSTDRHGVPVELWAEGEGGKTFEEYFGWEG